jgi:hypothetical protein
MTVVEPSEFGARWNAWYPDAEPRSWVMRAAYEDRWLRIHSLPNGKRYPDSDREVAVILARQNSLAGELLQDDGVVLLGYEYTGGTRIPPAHTLRRWLPDAAPVMRLASEDEDNDGAVSVFAGFVRWGDGNFDSALREVARGELQLILLNWKTGAAFAPYDGGADSFWRTEFERDLARKKFDEWLSTLPSGL